MGIDIYSECIIEGNNRTFLEIELVNYGLSFKYRDLLELQTDFPAKFHQISEALIKISQMYNKTILGLRIVLRTSLWAGAGLGSSASIIISLINAMNSYFSLDLDKEHINDLAFKLEHIVHGKPSGIDNSTCTFGHLRFYQNYQSEIIQMSQPLSFLVCYSGSAHFTSDVVNHIQSLNKNQPQYLQFQFQSIGEIVRNAKNALESGNYEELGRLMNMNQEILTALGLSTIKIDRIVAIAQLNGAYGAKLTGAGKGGAVIILIETSKLPILQKILQNEGFDTIIVNLNQEGTKYVVFE